MENKGYTFNGVAGRIRDVETKIGGNWYVSVCWLAMTRDSGKGAKRRLEDKVFGTNKPKVTSTFRNAWRIAGKSFAEGFHKGHRAAVAEMGLDDAIKFAMECLDAHKLALGVTSMGEYEDVCQYATKDDFQTADEPEGNADEPEGDTEGGNVDSDGKSTDTSETDVLANIKVAAESLTLEQTEELYHWLAARIEAAQPPMEEAA